MLDCFRALEPLSCYPPLISSLALGLRAASALKQTNPFNYRSVACPWTVLQELPASK